MSILQILVLAVVQGITEFLPVSSSGHLVLTPHVFGWRDQGLLIDVAVHVGTLGAVVVYLRQEIVQMLIGAFQPSRDDGARGRWLLVYLVLASLPVVVAGLLVKLYFGGEFRSIPVVGWATLGFGVVLYAADRMTLAEKRMEQMRMGPALIIGCAQVLALIPGASRSGMTITAARMLGFDRRAAARFSMLMSIPAILGAGSLGTLDLIKSGDAVLQADAVLATMIAFVTALIAIVAMMRWLARATFTPFVVYRILLGAGILLWWYL